MKMKVIRFLALFLGLLFGARSALATEIDRDIFLMYYEEKDLVVSSTRHLKPASETPDNITVIHQEAISAMSAHTVGDVLNRVTGLFVYFHTMDFASPAQAEIQGSFARQVLVMVDGFSWGRFFSGYLKLIPIPVKVVDRIEIIKGPACSVWGAYMGGVINIITKSSGREEGLHGALTTSYGEKNRQDHGLELRGRTRSLGYYAFGGYQYSDSSVTSDTYDSRNLFSKISFPIYEEMDVEVSAGYNKPEVPMGDPVKLLNDIVGRFTTIRAPISAPKNLEGDILIENRFFTTNLNHQVNRSLEWHVSLSYFNQESLMPVHTPENGMNLFTYALGEKSMNAVLSAVWTPEDHTIVVGMDYEHGLLDQEIENRFPGLNLPSEKDMVSEKWAVFVNDTLMFDRFSLTPSIRYDQNDPDGSFISPSIGCVFSLSSSVALKASIARGVTYVPLFWRLNASNNFPFNSSDLKPETLWAYQVGISYDPLKYALLKTNLFYYDMENSLSLDDNGTLINGEGTWCYGTELEIETLPVYRLSFLVGTAYVFREMLSASDATKRYQFHTGIRYDDKRSVNVDLFGHFTEWGRFVLQTSKEEDMIWDLTVNKKYPTFLEKEGKIFFKIHNLFNGSQYTLSEKGNPRRWVEGGVEIPF